MQHNDEKKEKQAYKKPRLRIIELTAEEVLAVGCKMTAGTPSSGIYLCGNINCAVTLGS